MVGDVIHVSGFTSGFAAINATSATVASVGNQDWPTVLTFTTAAGNGTYAQQAGVISLAYTAKPKPIWQPVSVVSSNTSLSLGVSAGTIAAGATYYAANDNYAAVQTLISSGQDINITTAGDYYVNNTPANTGQVDGAVLNNGFSHYFGMTTGARWVMTRSEYNAFRFVGGRGATFDRWTLDYINQVDTLAAGFPAALAVYYADHPRILNLSTSFGSGNFADVENCTEPQMIGFNFRNVANGGCYVFAANSHPVVSDGICIGSVDGSSIFQQNNFVDTAMRGAVFSNITQVNTGLPVWAGGPDIVASNFYIEGAQTNSISIFTSNNDLADVKLSGMQINNSGSLGPGVQVYNSPVIKATNSGAGVTLNDISIRESWGYGILADSGTTIKMSNITMDGMKSGGIYGFGASGLAISNTTITDPGGQGLVSLTSGDVRVDGLNIVNANRRYTSNWVSGNPGDAVVVANSTSDSFNNVRIYDNQATATGYQFFDGGTLNYGRINNVTGIITDATHPFRTAGGTAGSTFIKASGFVAAVGIVSSTISPISDLSTLGGSGSFNTITIAKGMQLQDEVCVIPAPGSTWTTTTGGNLGAASNAVAGRVLCWKLISGTWYPTY